MNYVIKKDKTAIRKVSFELAKDWDDSIFCVIDWYHNTISFDGKKWELVKYSKVEGDKIIASITRFVSGNSRRRTRD